MIVNCRIQIKYLHSKAESVILIQFKFIGIIMLDKDILLPPQDLRKTINDVYHGDEAQVISLLIEKAQLSAEELQQISNKARELVEQVRAVKKIGIDSFLTEYSLSSEEGIVLMCLAEAFLRVPDDPTLDS